VILDTGSSDGTLGVIKQFMDGYPGKIKLYLDTFGSNDFTGDEFRFANGFRQTEARAFLMGKTMGGRGPRDFIIHLDGDEVLNERFWEVLEDSDADALGHATDLAINPYTVSRHPLDMHKWGEFNLFDPHIRAWRVSAGGTWFYNECNSDIHPGIRWDRPPVVEVTPDNVHFHLHFSFGPKSIYSYMVSEEQTAQGASGMLGVPLSEMHNQKYFEEHFPDWFVDGRFIPKNIEKNIAWSKHSRFTKSMTHPLPSLVFETWKKWGQWIET
jgi:glycosyltransferase involved in cell wall biosynthesis